LTNNRRGRKPPSLNKERDMKTLEEVNRKHDKRKEFKALVRELGQKREAGEITSDEMVKRLDEFEQTL